MRAKKTGRTEKDKPVSRARGVRKPARAAAAVRKATAVRRARQARAVKAPQTARPMAALAQAMFEASERPAPIAAPIVATPLPAQDPAPPIVAFVLPDAAIPVAPEDPVSRMAQIALANAAPSVPASNVATPSQSRSWIGLAALAGCAASATFVILLMGRPSLAPADVSKAESLRPIEMPRAIASPVAQPKETSVRTSIAKAEPRPAAALNPPKTVAPAESLVPASAPTPAPIVLSASVLPPLPKLMAAADPVSHAAAPAATRASVNADAGMVTITGCLDTNKDGFRLNNTSGIDAPQSRSWKTGFFKKRSASVSLADAGRSGLSSHVGELVSITGILDDRDMQVHSVRRLAGSCE